MALKISENYNECGVNAGKIVKRMVRYLPSSSLKDLTEIRILSKDPADIGFAQYIKNAKRIELYINDILDEQPWLLKKTYIFPYLSIGMALGHELDHHVNRSNTNINQEKSAETNALKYIYPSMGVFKPLVKLWSLIYKFLIK